MPGYHNDHMELAVNRLVRGNSYKDSSTVCVIVTRGAVPAKVVGSWLNLMTPMNQKFMRFFVENMEVGEAYNYAVEQIMANTELSKWKYLLTLEEDNCPPPDGLLKLLESIARFDVVGGLYWTKGEAGQPMIYGDPKTMPRNYIPQVPQIDAVQECNGLGMGFNLFRMDIFNKVPKPWFRTVQEYRPGQGVHMATQDMFFYDQAAKHGCRFACDTRVRVGHWDQQNGVLW